MLLTDKAIVFLGNTRFDGEIKSTSLFIARNLAKHNKVFFVDYPFTLKDYFKTQFNSKELKLRKQKFSLFSDGIIYTDLDNLKIVVTPPVLPINFIPEGIVFRSLLKINERVIGRRINKTLRKEGIQDFIFINAFNFHYPDIAKEINPVLSVYQCVDPMIVPYDMKHGITSENKLVKESDVVICTSKALFSEKRAQNINTYFVPNGTDLNQNNVHNCTVYSLHEKLVGLTKPIIGYLGTIERRINYDLVQEVISANPDKTFVFAGPISDNFVPDSFYNLPNVAFIGPIPHHEVEQVISNFDVAMIPFKKDAVSNTIFPIKLFEYLSAGKPVVITDFNGDLKDYTENCIDYCSSAPEFTQAINNALTNDNDERRQERKALAKKNTWEIRADQIAEILNSHLI
jgi:teichuronic acid biosynthesis glycosyltransferase TuaH